MRAIVLVLGLISSNSWACMSPPTPITLGGTSFADEILLLGDVYTGVGMTSGGDDFFYDHALGKWCLKVSGSKKNQCEFPKGLALTDSKNPEKRVGLIEFDNKKGEFFIFSIGANGKKDLTKPYLKFKDSLKKGERTEYGLIAVETFEVEAVVDNKAVGRFEKQRGGTIDGKGVFEPTRFRGLSPALPKGAKAIDLAGHEISTAGCHGSTVGAYSGSSGSPAGNGIAK